MTTSPHDVLIVGGGAAGLRAAIAVAESHPQLSVAIVSKVYPMRSHTVSAEGGAAAVIRARRQPRGARPRHDLGRGLAVRPGRRRGVRQGGARGAAAAGALGLPVEPRADGHVAVRPFGGMKQMRTWFAADKTGFHLLHTLFQTSLKYDRIVRYDEWFVTRLLVDDGRACGVVAIELMSGRIEPITAKAVILATGGCGRVFPFTTNANIKTGDGMALAYRAGAPLKDMEFVQYHPTGLPFTGILITEAARAEGGWLLNKDGYRYLQDYDLGKPEPTPVLKSMELGPRDRLSQAFVKEVEKGRTDRLAVRPGRPPGPPPSRREGHHRQASDGAGALPGLREHRPGPRADPGAPGRALHDGRRLTPTSHGATPLPGLYAAGEVACVSINGANRLGLQLAAGVPGLRRPRRPGRRGVRRRREPIPGLRRSRRRETNGDGWSRRSSHRDGGREPISAIREEMQATMEDGAGIYRSARLAGQGRGQAARPAGAVRSPPGSTTTAARSTPS